MFTLCERSCYSPKLSRIMTSQQLPITPPTEGQTSMHETLTTPGEWPWEATLAGVLLLPVP